MEVKATYADDREASRCRFATMNLPSLHGASAAGACAVIDSPARRGRELP
jgi:hypothetical protein